MQPPPHDVQVVSKIELSFNNGAFGPITGDLSCILGITGLQGLGLEGLASTGEAPKGAHLGGCHGWDPLVG